MWAFLQSRTLSDTRSLLNGSLFETDQVRKALDLLGRILYFIVQCETRFCKCQNVEGRGIRQSVNIGELASATSWIQEVFLRAGLCAALFCSGA
jgi:hypothetical protein